MERMQREMQTLRSRSAGGGSWYQLDLEFSSHRTNISHKQPAPLIFPSLFRPRFRRADDSQSRTPRIPSLLSPLDPRQRELQAMGKPQYSWNAGSGPDDNDDNDDDDEEVVDQRCRAASPGGRRDVDNAFFGNSITPMELHEVKPTQDRWWLASPRKSAIMGSPVSSNVGSPDRVDGVMSRDDSAGEKVAFGGSVRAVASGAEKGVWRRFTDRWHIRWIREMAKGIWCGRVALFSWGFLNRGIFVLRNFGTIRLENRSLEK